MSDAATDTTQLRLPLRLVITAPPLTDADRARLAVLHVRSMSDDICPACRVRYLPLRGACRCALDGGETET